MALGINTSSETATFAPIVKYDARAGRFFRVDRSQDASGQWVKDDVDVTQGFSCVMDLATIEVGWIAFAGAAPDFRLGKVGEPIPPRPAGNDDKGKPLYKQGFCMRMKLAKSIGGDVREWAHTAKVVLGAVDELHNTFLNAPEAKAGKLPVVKLIGTVPVKSGTGANTSTNYAPKFEIAQWIERPADLPLAAATNGAATNGHAEAAKPNVPPPVTGKRASAPPPPKEAADVGAEF